MPSVNATVDRCKELMNAIARLQQDPPVIAPNYPPKAPTPKPAAVATTISTVVYPGKATAHSAVSAASKEKQDAPLNSYIPEWEIERTAREEKDRLAHQVFQSASTTTQQQQPPGPPRHQSVSMHPPAEPVRTSYSQPTTTMKPAVRPPANTPQQKQALPTTARPDPSQSNTVIALYTKHVPTKSKPPQYVNLPPDQAVDATAAAGKKHDYVNVPDVPLPGETVVISF